VCAKSHLGLLLLELLLLDLGGELLHSLHRHCLGVVGGIRGQSNDDGLERKGRGTGALCSRGTVARCGLAAEGRVGKAVWGWWVGSDG
jgi:hypothetical protein